MARYELFLWVPMIRSILEEATVTPKKEGVAEALVSFVKNNKEPLFIGVIAYFILKKVTGVDLLP